jgi:hypothetical protein
MVEDEREERREEEGGRMKKGEGHVIGTPSSSSNM